MCSYRGRTCHFAAKIERLFQQRFHHREVVGGTRFCPHVVGFARVAEEFGDEGRWDFGPPFVVAPGDADQAGVVVIVGQAFLQWAQVVQQLAHGGVDELFVRQPAEGGRLSRARCRSAGWHICALIPSQHRASGLQIVASSRRVFSSCSLGSILLLCDWSDSLLVL